ncbi:amyloid-beta precursor protein-like [Anticarsia gemmatalis]|uniref:amyloid-beta precursor protein-like n=1 Tax=Anticarsia gemmatalis TaxID=129554 RepID=UPI003F763669
MRTHRTLFCLFIITVIRSTCGKDLIDRHDYVKDGRPVDGPFPSSLKNAPYYCYQVPNKGPCTQMIMVWFFDIIRRKCMRMFYSGCGGNENRFTSEQSCKLHCETVRRI